MDTHIWRFPEIGVPLVFIHFSGIFYYKPSSYWDIPISGNHHIIAYCGWLRTPASPKGWLKHMFFNMLKSYESWDVDPSGSSVLLFPCFHRWFFHGPNRSTSRLGDCSGFQTPLGSLKSGWYHGTIMVKKNWWFPESWGIPNSWLVYNGPFHYWMIWGVPLFSETSICWYVFGLVCANLV